MNSILLTSEEKTVLLNALDNRVVQFLNSELSYLDKNELDFIKRMEARLLEIDISDSCVNFEFTSREMNELIYSLARLLTKLDIFGESFDDEYEIAEYLLNDYCLLID